MSRYYGIDDVIDITLGPTIETEQHTLTFVALVCSLRAKHILELGVQYGGSTYPLLVGAKIVGGHVTSVDNVYYGYVPPVELIQHWSFVLQDSIKFLRQNTKEYDLILIDDLHTTEHVYEELKLIERFATKKTVILLHDLMHSGRQPEYNTDVFCEGEFVGTGPHGALSKFLQEHLDFEYSTIPVSHGLTILRRQ